MFVTRTVSGTVAEGMEEAPTPPATVGEDRARATPSAVTIVVRIIGPFLIAPHSSMGAVTSRLAVVEQE